MGIGFGRRFVQAGLHHALPYLRRGRLKWVLPGLHDPGMRELELHYRTGCTWHRGCAWW